ncbi:MAG TPA: TIGR02996 domain-containing protein [Gemmataceae bacterium]|nr:TIGR02996 domain-containing protein [Gemmataceae bacterium]
MTNTDEDAFWRAIGELPADDARWLVYADWLDDRGRDGDAGIVRRFLADLRAADY